MRNKNFAYFAIVLFVSILAASTGLAITWGITERNALIFNSGSESSAIRVKQLADGNHEGLYQQLNRFSQEHNIALIIDGEGDGFPGLAVVDPLAILPWLNQHSATSARAEPGETERVYIFENTFCASAYAQTGACELTPPNSEITAVIAPPAGVSYHQYALVPGISTPLISARIILTSKDPVVLSKITQIFEQREFDTRAITPPPLWLELAQNRPIMISGGLFAGGLFCAAVFWKTRRQGFESKLRIRITARHLALTVRRRPHTLSITAVLGL
ncbi:hypothetical protein KJY77_02765 [Canibacter sp. lx-72]|uniref:hypothetical protein n=1 Tax=Canibacter zhuwentaonis TaxID=2837491 RepID=UPI001BDD8C66|nr:hypothetical protein [Canibacter zhuwentaonis]MBT1018064.1 hypothetical protein [Canibacter zhuwentaonis]